MFLDEAVIAVQGGVGGRGCIGWRREKYVPKGGPDGGDGGNGGSIFFKANRNADTLSEYASKKRFKAEQGGFGSGNDRHGRNGEDMVLIVPPGTLIYDVTNGEKVLVADLSMDGDEVLIARGGRGGYGNAHFVSSIRQKPDFAELGEPGEEKQLLLELKLVADVGIIGFPNAGKSTLISVISAARPKIANYAFTTIVPNLGVVQIYDRAFVVCDIPGLIEGASEGKGLGHQFLKHIERCGVLLHVLDLSRAMVDGVVDPALLIEDYQTIRKELKAYSPTLEKKRELVVLNKIDLIPNEELAPVIKALEKKKIPLFASISAATVQGTADLVSSLLPIVLEERTKRMQEVEEEQTSTELPVLKPQETSDKMGSYRIERREDGAVVIRGKRIEQMAIMTNFDSDGAIRRFQDIIERIGLLAALKRMKLPPDTQIIIGEANVGSYLF